MLRAARRVRVIFALGAALLLPAWIARSGHMVLVSHAVCAAHGELVHEAHEPRHETTTAQAVFAAGDHDDSHEHCNAVATDQLVSAPPFAIEGEVLPLVASNAPVTRLIVTSRQALLLRAPKTSPPA